MTNTRRGDRLTGYVGVALLTLTLAACGGSDPQPGNTGSSTAPPSTAPPTTGSSTTGPAKTTGREAAMRARLIAALREESPTQAELLERRETSVTTLSTPWLADWQVVDVLARMMPHPVRFFAAISSDGTVVQLTGRPAEFSEVIQRALLDVASAKVAVEVAEVYLDSTQDFQKASYRIDSVDDVRWLKTMTAAQARKKAELERELPKVVRPAKAEPYGDGGWSVTIWMMYDRRLDEHLVRIGSDGAVSDQVVHTYDGMPTPESY